MTLASLQTAYPDFVPNQVLTDAQLNQLRDYLDGQTRLGRLRTVGQGIACGLSVTTTTAGDPTVRIEGGYGITSDGYLIEHGADAEAGGDVVFEPVTYARVADYVDPVTTVGVGGATSTPAYEPWRDGSGTGQLPLLRLLTDEEAAEGARALTTDDLEDAAVVLYLEQAAQELDGCFVTSCDDRGRRVQHAVRVLLVRAHDLPPAPHPGLASPPPPRPLVPRLAAVLASSERALTDLRSGGDLVRIVEEAVNEGIGSIGRALDRIGEQYGATLGLDLGDVPDELARAAEALGAAPLAVLEHVGTAAEAVALLGQAACASGAACGAPGGYGRHLALSGEAFSEEDAPAPFDDSRRHHFLPAPLVTRAARAAVARAAGRLRAIARAFDAERIADREEPGDVVATASQTARHALGDRAIPAYYDPRELAPFWPDACDGGPLAHAGALIDLDGSVVDERASLDAAYSGVSLVRIEGLLRLPAEPAAEAVRRLQQQFGLEFSLVVAGLDAAPDLEDAVFFEEWAADKPGLEPMAGVEPGGTFVLLTDEGRVIGDLALRCCAGRAPEPEPEPEPTVGDLGITVRVDGEPLADALVTVTRQAQTIRTGRTDADGEIQFAALAPGAVTVEVTAAGYQKGTVSGVEVVAGALTEVAVTLEPLVAQGILQVIACPGRVPGGIVAVDGDNVDVLAGGSVSLALDEGDHEIAVPDRLSATVKRPFFERARLKLTTRFTVEAGRRTVLFVTQDAEGLDTVVSFIEDVPRVSRERVRIRVFNDAAQRGPVTVYLDADQLVLAEDLAPGAVADPAEAPARDDRLWVITRQIRELFDFPASDLGGRSIAALVCEEGVLFVSSEKDRVAATLIKGARPADPEADVSASIPTDSQEILKLRERERIRETEEAARGTGIKNTKTYDEAIAFIEKTAARPDVRAEDLTDEYREVVEMLEIRIRDGSGTTAEGYRKLLESTTLAYLDRAARYPEGGGAVVEVEVRKIQDTLVANGLNATAVRDKWNPEQLEVALETSTGTVRRF